MKQLNKVIGNAGELEAFSYLKKNKYKVLTVNYKTIVGEIDIIAQEKDIIVFIEVKKRETYLFGRPSEAVGVSKQQKIRKTALYYLKQYKLLDKQCRFDIIEIVGNNLNHIKDAF